MSVKHVMSLLFCGLMQGILSSEGLRGKPISSRVSNYVLASPLGFLGYKKVKNKI